MRGHAAWRRVESIENPEPPEGCRQAGTAAEILAGLDWENARPSPAAGRFRCETPGAAACGHCPEVSGAVVPEPNEIDLKGKETARMNEDQEKAHSEHLRQAQDHFRWRREHMEALAILKKAEAAIFAHEARILAHDAEIARHEEQIAHGAAHSKTPPIGEHAQYASAHESGTEHHSALLEAIRGLGLHVDAAFAK